MPCLAGLVLLAGGCAHRETTPRAVALVATPDIGPTASASASAVFPPASLAITAADPFAPWYADRLDHGPSLPAGYQTPTLRATTTYTVDHQSSFHGRVFNNYRTTTYTTSTSEQIR